MEMRVQMFILMVVSEDKVGKSAKFVAIKK